MMNAKKTKEIRSLSENDIDKLIIFLKGFVIKNKKKLIKILTIFKNRNKEYMVYEISRSLICVLKKYSRIKKGFFISIGFPFPLKSIELSDIYIT